MWNFVYFLVAMGIALLAVRALGRLSPRDTVPRRAPRMSPSARPVTGTAAASKSDLAPIQWAEALSAPPPLEGDALRDRLRDRYIAARFPGLATCAADLERVDDVIRSARLCFDEEKYEQAQELLHMAIERVPDSEPLPLAQLEIAFLRRDPAEFVSLATKFRVRHPQNRNWSEVARLGRAIAPDHPLFAAGPGSRPHEHYGPWPDMPNWIQASWDLTAEVQAADFHRAILRDPVARARSADHRLIA